MDFFLGPVSSKHNYYLMSGLLFSRQGVSVAPQSLIYNAPLGPILPFRIKMKQK